MCALPSAFCEGCGGVCSTDDLDRRPYKLGLWPQKPVEIPGPDYLDRYRNYCRPLATPSR